MNADAHHAVRRLYVQLLHAQHGAHDIMEEEEPGPLPPGSTNVPTNRNPLSTTTSLERNGAPEKTAPAPSPSSPAAVAVASYTPSAPSRHLPGPAASPAATARFASRVASGFSNARSSHPGGLKGWWRRRCHRYSRSPSTAVGSAALGDEEVTSAAEVRQWKMRLGRTLRQRSFQVEEQLREMLAEHLRQCLKSGAISALTAPSEQGTPARFSAPSLLRVLSTGYAVTISVQNASRAEDGVRGQEAHDVGQNLFFSGLGKEASSKDDTSRYVDNPRQRGDAYEQSAREAEPKSPDIQAAPPRPPASKLVAATAPAAATSAPKAAPSKKSSFQAQLKACQADLSQSWQSAGMPSNPLVPVHTAALCSRLNAHQTDAAGATTNTDALANVSPTTYLTQEEENSDTPVAARPPACTLWEYLPISSSLHISMSPAIEKDGKPVTAPAAFQSTTLQSPMDKIRAAWCRRARKPALGIPQARSNAAEADKRAAAPNTAAHDPIALTTDGHWHRLQAQARAAQDVFRILLEDAASYSQDGRQKSGGTTKNTAVVSPSSQPPPLSAYAPFSHALLPGVSEAEDSATAVVMVCYTAAPHDLDAVSWSTGTCTGDAPAETSPSVSLQPTWVLCFEVDALHEAWLRRTLLEVASRESTSSPESVAAASTSPLPTPTHDRLDTTVTLTALRANVLASLQSMCACS
ncbi:hypothetical protein, unknown function [Leishmania donovani]|uniref:Uncharacterized protein n=1 Tax=Leishmania donovani TaxID=5661 RepID=A0A3Q8IBK4_LEIDO|nr:hypothetical protein, unknown function [Leishmania donovani]AYU79008.1 hypothetical protein LdCL_230019700 [Leishmania donovani]TPP50236.1 hypothetical protein CGC21_17095 [Leishmania donovani]CBZ34316.1 hypothetical protein, unknown function [Leishmania donovani]